MAHNKFKVIWTNNFSPSFFILIWSWCNTPSQNFVKSLTYLMLPYTTPHHKIQGVRSALPQQSNRIYFIYLTKELQSIYEIRLFFKKKRKLVKKKNSLDLPNLGCYPMSTNSYKQSGEHSSFTFKVKQSKGSAVSSYRWRKYAPFEHQQIFTSWDNKTSQNIASTTTLWEPQILLIA